MISIDELKQRRAVLEQELLDIRGGRVRYKGMQKRKKYLAQQIREIDKEVFRRKPARPPARPLTTTLGDKMPSNMGAAGIPPAKPPDDTPPTSDSAGEPMSRKYVASSPAATADSPPPRTPPTHAATPPAPESRRPIIVKARDIDPFRKAIIRMRDRHDGVNNSHCKLTAKELTQILRDHPAGDSDVRGRIEHLARRNEELEGAVADLEKELKAALELLGYAEQRASVRAH